MDSRDKEVLDLLAGRRSGRARRQAAVRLEDLGGLLELTPRLKAVKTAGAAPTKDEFDALVDDVAAIHRVLLVVVHALQARVLP